MADVLDGIARHLHALGLVDYRPDSAGGSCFLDDMPPTPDDATALTLYGGPEPDSRLPYDDLRLQVRARGGKDRRAARDRVQAVYGQLHGLGPVDLPDGTRLILCVALQSGASSIGRDESGRHEFVCNFRLEVIAVTAHRP